MKEAKGLLESWWRRLDGSCLIYLLWDILRTMQRGHLSRYQEGFSGTFSLRYYCVTYLYCWHDKDINIPFCRCPPWLYKEAIVLMQKRALKAFYISFPFANTFVNPSWLIAAVTHTLLMLMCSLWPNTSKLWKQAWSTNYSLVSHIHMKGTTPSVCAFLCHNNPCTLLVLLHTWMHTHTIYYVICNIFAADDPRQAARSLIHTCTWARYTVDVQSKVHKH